MSHAAEGSLQALLDGELDSAATAALDEHLSTCDACASELETLRLINHHVHTTLAVLDRPAPMLRAQARIAATRRSPRAMFAFGGLARAAMLLLALGGVAAAIPPVRQAVENSFARVARLFQDRTSVADAPVEPVVPAPTVNEPAGMYVSPANGRIRILLHAPAGSVDIVVALTDDERAKIEYTQDATASFRSGTGRLEVMGITEGTVRIGIPRSVPNATVEIDGVVYVYKQNASLRRSEQAQSDRVRVQIE